MPHKSKSGTLLIKKILKMNLKAKMQIVMLNNKFINNMENLALIKLIMKNFLINSGYVAIVRQKLKIQTNYAQNKNVNVNFIRNASENAWI